MSRSAGVAVRWRLPVLAAVLAGATATTLWPAIGAHLFGAGLLAATAWLFVFDVARRTVWRWSGIANVVAVLSFAACAIALSLRRRPAAPCKARPMTTAAVS